MYFAIRLSLAPIHFNENYDCAQALTSQGKEHIQIVFPKAKHEELTPKPVPVVKAYSKLYWHPHEFVFFCRLLCRNTYTISLFSHYKNKLI